MKLYFGFLHYEKAPRCVQKAYSITPFSLPRLKKPNRHPELLNETVNNFSDGGTKYPRHDRAVRETLAESFFYPGNQMKHKQTKNYNRKK